MGNSAAQPARFFQGSTVKGSRLTSARLYIREPWREHHRSGEPPVLREALNQESAMRDFDVRSALLKQLQLVHRGEADTRIVQEMGVWAGTVRIDVAVINGELSGFELKSDKDTLERLPAQASLYNRVFDRVTLVTGARHVEKAQPLIPDWWGVQAALVVDGGVVLSGIRPALKNPEPDPFLVAELLWKSEAIEVLDRFGLARGWRSKTVNLIHARLANELPFSVLSEQVRSTLKSREAWSGQTVSH